METAKLAGRLTSNPSSSSGVEVHHGIVDSFKQDIYQRLRQLRTARQPTQPRVAERPALVSVLVSLVKRSKGWRVTAGRGLRETTVNCTAKETVDNLHYLMYAF
jgi:hypothetical protein